jgi:IS5 family transposase
MMTQRDLGLNLSTKRTRKREILYEMTHVVPWQKLVVLIEPQYPKGETSRPPFPVATMLRINFLQQWFSLSDPAMEEALHDIPLYREFALLGGSMTPLPDESTIQRSAIFSKRTSWRQRCWRRSMKSCWPRA